MLLSNQQLTNNDSTVETSTNTALQFFLPVMTAMNIPMSLTNFFVILNIGFLNSPSIMIYFNLVIVDLLNSAVGVMISVDLWNNTDHQSATFWGKGGHEMAFSYVYIFTFNMNIVLVLGLCLIRVLWTELSALQVLTQLKVVSWVTIALANFYGVFCCLLWYHESQKKSFMPHLLIPSHAVEVNDILDCAIILSALYMSIYTQARIWLNKSRVNISIFLAASRSSLIITLNVAVSYSFFVAMVATRIYYKVPWENKFTCPKDGVWSFTNLLLCDELYLTITFMCFQSTMNSFILLFQRQTSRFLRVRGRMCVLDMKRKCSECCTCGDDSDYEYL